MDIGTIRAKHIGWRIGTPYFSRKALVAQWILEHPTPNRKDVGSIPIWGNSFGSLEVKAIDSESKDQGFDPPPKHYAPMV